MNTVDPLDARILLAIDADPDASVLGLARTLGVARNTVQARLRRLAASGALGAPSRRVAPAALGRPLTAFVFIAISQLHEDEALAGLGQIPEVVELHSTTGDTDLLARLVARDSGDLRRITGQILTVPGVVRTNTRMSLAEVMPMRLAPLLESLAEGRDE